ncbi:MAG: hypothetical protein GY931_03675 [Maribacter sp.]|nr:hypothetical protein [Maribacter sp.]
MDIDFNNKLEVTIKNEKPVILTDLTLSLLGINQQFQRFLEQETNEDYQPSTELYIKEVRSGSIVVELVALAMPVVPLIWEGGALKQWLNQAEALLQWFLGKLDKPPKEITKNDLKQWNSILEPVAKDNASQLNLTVSDNSKVINQIFINSQEANAAQNRIIKEINSLEDPDDHIQKRRVMRWYQTKFDTESHTGDKAIIETISKSAIKVIFENNAVKEAILKGDDRYSKPWHKLAYIVDVEVQTVEGKPKLYTILKYYPDDTFDFED